MIWITKIISKEDGDTPREARENAIKLIDNWCKENDFEYEIHHNDVTGCNRVLFIKTPYKTYAYKFIISVYSRPTGEYEESESLFGGKWLNEITEPAYYAHLDRF